jgi:hypothetical protein
MLRRELARREQMPEEHKEGAWEQQIVVISLSEIIRVNFLLPLTRTCHIACYIDKKAAFSR